MLVKTLETMQHEVIYDLSFHAYLSVNAHVYVRKCADAIDMRTVCANGRAL